MLARGAERGAARGDGQVIELEHGITVYPAREAGGRWRAVWPENGERQQCEATSVDKLAVKPGKIIERLDTPGGYPLAVRLAARIEAARAEQAAQINPRDIRHAYQQVTDKIAARIVAGTYVAKLPSERDLAKEFDVSYTTTRHAMAILREHGLIVSRW